MLICKSFKVEGFPLSPVHPVPLPPVSLRHMAMSAQIELDAGMLLESWSGPIYMETMKQVQVIFPFAPSSFPPSLLMSSFFWAKISAKSIGVLFDKWTIDPVLIGNPFSTVECSGMGSGLHICSGGPAGSQCLHIINSSSLSPLICSCILSDQAYHGPLHLSPSIQMKNDLAKWAVLTECHPVVAHSFPCYGRSLVYTH